MAQFTEPLPGVDYITSKSETLSYRLTMLPKEMRIKQNKETKKQATYLILRFASITKK